jgi:hypothetical protein
MERETGRFSSKIARVFKEKVMNMHNDIDFFVNTYGMLKELP